MKSMNLEVIIMTEYKFPNGGVVSEPGELSLIEIIASVPGPDPAGLEGLSKREWDAFWKILHE